MQSRRRICERMIPPWIERCCDVGNGIYERAGALYDSWRSFAHSSGEEPGSPGEFAAAMEARGYPSDRIPPIERGRIRWGLRLR
jgi:hypothetical protein